LNAGGGSSAGGFAGAVPWPLIETLREGEDVSGCFLVLEVQRGETRGQKEYLKVRLGDRSGTIDGFVWDEVERWEPLCVPEAVVGIRGRVASFQDRLQLKVQSVETVAPDAAVWELLLATAPRDRRAMEQELDALLWSVEDRPLRKLLRRLVGDGEGGSAYRAHPAAQRNHHAYVGGLLEHSLSVAGICSRLAEHYSTQGQPLDRDLLVAGALLHDIGKLVELRPPPASGYTTEGKLLGHILVGLRMVREAAAELSDLSSERLLLLEHLIASHQGRPEWDSPRVPQTLEAMVLHYADDLDSKMNSAGRLIAGVEAGEWSAYDRGMGRSFHRPVVQGEEAPEAARRRPDADTMDLFQG
jgi:3'-5' exoribonuclease